MDTILYPDFLEDITSYQAASDFWQVKLDPLFRKLGLSKQNYLNTTMVNGVDLQVVLFSYHRAYSCVRDAEIMGSSQRH